ncbi:colicin transporter [Pseudophaeobacter sp.]|uniref:colicin transporter n=1 Tax=Pseudophaeobacter sp. TaxID=1971739 RepID=UPI00329A6903
MTQIEELQGRILTAMERISDGVGKLEQASAEAKEAARAAADNSDLEQALEEEKTANAQLQERVKVLHTRIKQEEEGVAAVTPAELEALQSELELLRNEVGNTDEKDALKQEVTRLKGELESAGNGLAAEKEALETQVSELSAANEQLQAQVAEAAGAGEADLGNAVDQAALEAEITALKAQLEQAQSAAAEPTAVAEDGEVEQLRSTNAALTAEVEALQTAQAKGQDEVNAVLAKLEPLLASAQAVPEQNLPEGEEV